MTNAPVDVFGPAYLDRVLRVDRPLHAEGRPALDRSVDGRLEPGVGLGLADEAGRTLAVELPDRWPGPFGVVRLRGIEFDPEVMQAGPVAAVAWQDDLGGMGAGYAKALDGTLTSALGPEGDSASASVSRLLAEAGIRHRPIRVAGSSADWTLLLTSGRHGDKLPVGFRGCHASLEPAELARHLDPGARLLVVAALPNPLSSALLRGGAGAAIRFFAPAMRNMTDRTTPLSGFAGAVDLLACNRHEWDALGASSGLPREIPFVLVTDGADGAEALFRSPAGQADSIRVPAFPRARPPRDTNRAGEAFASAMIRTLLDEGWTPGPTPAGLALRALLRGSAAAALVLDRVDFGFPDRDEVDRALAHGKVG